MNITGVIGIPTTGVSNLSVQQQLVSELDSQQTQLDQLQTEISTGQQFQLPSQNPQAAMQVESIQSLLQRYTQSQTNISAAQASLSQTDSTLSSVSNLLTSVQSAALSVVGSTASDSQRQAVVQQVDAAVQQMVALGNTTFDGQQLFGGTNTTTSPFSINAAGNVVYAGTADPTESYVNLNQLTATSITGAQAFGAISQPIQGAALTPALSADTPLADLNGGQGVAPGSIAISDGHSTSIVNLSGAQTLGDVATLIEQNPPAGRTVDVNVTPTGLTLQLEPSTAFPSGDNLSVQEVGSGTTAGDLGILNANGVGPADPPLVGQTLTAAVTPTTPVSTLFGTQAQANIHFGQPNSDIVLQANTPGSTSSNGTLLNGVTVQFDGDASAGKEWATFDPGSLGTPGTLTVHISASATSGSTASQIVAAINKVPGLPFTASLDPSDQNGGGQSPITTLPAATTTAGGSGTTLDPAGLQITSAGQTYTVDLSGDKTVQDVLNSINDCGAGLNAQINSAKTGIDVTSQVSGDDFSIGENGGTTATQLGLRTFTTATRLSQLNHGAGVGVNTVTAGGTDFTISETLDNSSQGIQVPVSIAGDSTVGDVINSINSAAQSAGATFRAQLATTGNGIELTESNVAAGPIVVTASSGSTAANDLGLVSQGQTSATSTATAATATGWESSPGNNELLIQAVNPNVVGNVQVAFQVAAGTTEGNETVQYTPQTNSLTFNISAQTTANDIISALNKNPAVSALFTASLDTADDPTNNGDNPVGQQQVTMFGGTARLGSNTELQFQAVNPGNSGNVQVIFQTVPGITEGSEQVQYSPTANTLTFSISGQTTANDIIAALKGSPTASAVFTASLDKSSDPTNNGDGVIQSQQITLSGGEETLTGSDTNPQETDSAFNALLRLGTALTSNDNVAIQRAMGLLTSSMQNLDDTRDQLGVQEQSLTTLNTQISNETTNLTSTMSTAYDTDMASAVSEYTSAQIAYQATLETTADMLKMTLLNYL